MRNFAKSFGLVAALVLLVGAPHHMDFELSTGAVWLAIYSVSPKALRLNYVEAEGDNKRPTVFATTADTPGTVIVMRKADAAAH